MKAESCICGCESARVLPIFKHIRLSDLDSGTSSQLPLLLAARKITRSDVQIVTDHAFAFTTDEGALLMPSYNLHHSVTSERIRQRWLFRRYVQVAEKPH